VNVPLLEKRDIHAVIKTYNQGWSVVGPEIIPLIPDLGNASVGKRKDCCRHPQDQVGGFLLCFGVIERK
jgi:hypothetical protein